MGAQSPNTVFPLPKLSQTPYQAYTENIDTRLNALPWYDPTKYVGKGVMGLSDMFSKTDNQ